LDYVSFIIIINDYDYVYVRHSVVMFVIEVRTTWWTNNCTTLYYPVNLREELIAARVRGIADVRLLQLW